MKLTRIERWILSSQYRLLQAIYPDEADYFGQCREILERGYELHYDWITEYIYDGNHVMSSEECKEVIDILDMFSTLNRAYEALDDKSGIEEWTVKFSGFDGNNETKQLAYGRFFCSSDGGRFQDLDRPKDFNSHSPVLAGYRRMLGEWRRSADKYHLDRDDVIRISSARIHGAA